MDGNNTLPICAGNETDCNNSTVEDSDQCSVPYPSNIPPAVDYVQAAITIIIITLSLTINSIIVYLVFRYKQLRQRSFYLALQLIVINFIYTLLVLPTVVVTSIIRSWIFGSVMCIILGASTSFFFTGHYMMILTMALDRFFAVFMPFFYNRHGNKIAVVLSIILWPLSSLGPIAAIVLDCYTFIPMYKTCASSACNSACALFVPIYGWIFVLSCNVIPLMVYVALYLKGKQLQRKANVGMSPEEKAKTAFNGRVCKTFAIIAMVFIGVGLTSFVFYAWFTIEFSRVTLEYYIAQSLVGRTMASSITIADPVIILRNRDVHDAWSKHHGH